MVGVYSDGVVHGGICAVIDQYRRSAIAERFRVLLTGNSSTGGPVMKAAAIIGGCLALAWNCAFKDVSLVHLHTASGVSFYRKSACFFIAKLFRKKTVVHIHGGGFIDFYGRSNPMVRSLVRQVLDHADHIIVLSESFRSAMLSITKNRNLSVVYNPIRVMDFACSRSPDPAASPKLLFMGDVIERKGIGELIGAMRIVTDRIPQATLQIFGKGRLDFYRQMAAEQGVAGAVTFGGFISGPEKIEAYRSSSLFLLPSYVEGMPMVIVEAMAAGLPVVATTAGGIPEIVEEGINGFLVPPRDTEALADRILRILSNPGLLGAMSDANARKARDVFDIDTIAPKICRIYDDLLNAEK